MRALPVFPLAAAFGFLGRFRDHLLELLVHVAFLAVALGFGDDEPHSAGAGRAAVRSDVTPAWPSWNVKEPRVAVPLIDAQGMRLGCIKEPLVRHAALERMTVEAIDAGEAISGIHHAHHANSTNGTSIGNPSPRSEYRMCGKTSSGIRTAKDDRAGSVT